MIRQFLIILSGRFIMKERWFIKDEIVLSENFGADVIPLLVAIVWVFSLRYELQ